MIIFIVPATIQPLQNKTITEGGNLNLSCKASGTPPPVVSWARIRSGQQFNGSLLQLTNVFRNQAGDYRCKASNNCGTKSSTARIYVKCKCLFKHGVTSVSVRLVNSEVEKNYEPYVCPYLLSYSAHLYTKPNVEANHNMSIIFSIIIYLGNVWSHIMVEISHVPV